MTNSEKQAAQRGARSLFNRIWTTSMIVALVAYLLVIHNMDRPHFFVGHW